MPAGFFYKSAPMPLNNNAYNSAVQQFGNTGLQQLKSIGKSLGITHRSNSLSPGDSLSRMKVRFAFDATGQINKISFTNINRTLIYAAEGAGKGRGGIVGSRWIDFKGGRHITDPKSLGKAGSGNRRQKPFIQRFLDGTEGVERLADIVASEQADLIVANIFTK